MPKNNPQAAERKDLLHKLCVLLEVAGTQTPWTELAMQLRRLNTPNLRALEYRVRQAISDAYEEGANACDKQ
jgi:hypothetical protein